MGEERGVLTISTTRITSLPLQLWTVPIGGMLKNTLWAGVMYKAPITDQPFVHGNIAPGAIAVGNL